MRKNVVIAVLGTLSLAACAGAAALAAGCSQAADKQISVDLYDYETLGVRDYYDVRFADYLPDTENCGAYADGLEFTVMEDRVRLSGLKEGTFDVFLGTEGQTPLKLSLSFTSTAEYNLVNGGFEKGTMDGWEGDLLFDVCDEVTYFDNLYTPTPSVGQDGWYFLDSFGMSDGLNREGSTGDLRSSEFLAGGSGIITFKLGGGCSDDVTLSLMCGDETVAVFNNYAFSDPYRSLGLTEYFYRIPDAYMGKKLHFRLHDGATTDFGGITADSFRTYYEDSPDVSAMFEAGFSSEKNSGSDWIGYEGGNGTRRAYSPYFTLTYNLAFALKGGNAEGLKLRLVSDQGEELAVFNNWRKTESSYIYVTERRGTKCRFILDDTDRFSDLEVTEYHMTGDVPDDISVFGAGFVRGEPYDLDNYLRPDEASVALDGDFETLGNWFTVDMEGYAIYEDAPFFSDIYKNNPPVYGSDGKFLTGGYLGGDMSGFAGTGTLYSRAFIVGGSGFITFKLGGNNLETLSLRLMKYEENGEHTEIARFNNYLFSDPYRSMALTTYGYQIPAKYMGEKCFFMLVDEEQTASFGALSIDSVQTYYETAPEVFTGSPAKISDRADSITIAEDKNIYPAGYMVPYFSDLTEHLGLDGSGETLRNGGFEQGSTGWFSADPNAFSSYRVSDETTYFDAIYPNNIPIFNKTGTYFLNGFSNESFRGNIYSQAFVANGWITFKLGGGNSEGLRFKLMHYVDGVQDEEIAVFNNYLFSDPYRSMTMTRYAYRIPEEYNGEYCYFVIEDTLTTNFGAITVDEVITHYTAPPVIDGKPTDDPKDDTTFMAGYKGATYV